MATGLVLYLFFVKKEKSLLYFICFSQKHEIRAKQLVKMLEQIILLEQKVNLLEQKNKILRKSENLYYCANI
jgi:hypothetical protein